MPKAAVGLITLFVVCSAGYAADQLRFWNLTSVTISGLYLAPAGTDKWGPNQCENDPDKEVDSDERLTLTGIAPGRYDVRLTDKNKQVCFVFNVEVVSGKPYAFSISDKDLTTCAKF